MLRRVLLLTALIALSSPAVALAGPVLDSGAFSEKRWEAIVGYRPCGGQITYRFTNIDPPRIGQSVFYDRAQRLKQGVGCRVELAERYREYLYDRPGLLCSVVLHEVGHLAGRPHSDNPRSVMFPGRSRVDPRCRGVIR